MESSREVICPARLRRVPDRFSWVDQRLVRDRHLERLDVYAAALYLFLVTVADAQGLSWYGDPSVARRLSIDAVRLRRARADLVQAGLLAYARPLYQVLALGDPWAPHAPPQRVVPDVAAAQPIPPATGRAAAREQLAALRAALGKPP
jgi:hypothetical protein